MEEDTRYYEIDVVAYAQLAPRTFTYAHPSSEPLEIGQIVQVPFGRRTSLGVVISPSNPTSALKSKIKAITACVSDLVIPQHLLDLAVWVKDYYAASSHATWSAILPSGLTAKRRKTFKRYYWFWQNAYL
jgi:primosomal protein N' (replication factor Y) (superfamily II helicase)